MTPSSLYKAFETHVASFILTFQQNLLFIIIADTVTHFQSVTAILPKAELYRASHQLVNQQCSCFKEKINLLAFPTGRWRALISNPLGKRPKLRVAYYVTNTRLETQCWFWITPYLVSKVYNNTLAPLQNSPAFKAIH